MGREHPGRVMPGGVAPAPGPSRWPSPAGEEQSAAWPGRWGSEWCIPWGLAGVGTDGIPTFVPVQPWSGRAWA